MGLINLKTDLKSLRYLKDRIGGGDSGQPYVQAAIPDDISPYIGTTDYLNRGGINVVRDSELDVLRLGKMFTDTKSPNGIFFTSKQELLSRTAVRTQTSGVLNEGIYTPLSTLAQAGVVAFGGHLNKQGVNPFANTGAYANNDALYGVKVKPTQPINENRLAELLRGSYLGTSINYDNQSFILNNGSANVITYSGGPGAVLGVGTTNIRYSKTSQTPLSKAPKSSNHTSTADSVGTNDWTYSAELTETEPSQVTQNGYASPKIQDFRQKLRATLRSQDKNLAEQSGATPNSLDYNTKNIDLRTNQGQPGQRAGKSYVSYTKGVTNLEGNSFYGLGALDGVPGSFKKGLDVINSVSIYRSETSSTDAQLDDLVDFRIAVIDNDSPTFKTFLHFRALLGPVQDSYNATWNPFNYLGRGEQFYTYNGFTRQMSLSWTVAAQSKEELIPMYKKLNYLASTLTPDYSGNGFMRGNLVQLTIGGYVYEQPGFITGLTYDIQEDTPWEIGINDTDGAVDNSVRQLPHIIRVTGFSFTPIQKFLPRKQQLSFYGDDETGLVTTEANQGYISLENKNGSLYQDLPYTIPPPTTTEEIQTITNEIDAYTGPDWVWGS